MKVILYSGTKKTDLTSVCAYAKKRKSNGADSREHFEHISNLLIKTDRRSILKVVSFYSLYMDPETKLFENLTPKQRVYYGIK